MARAIKDPESEGKRVRFSRCFEDRVLVFKTWILNGFSIFLAIDPLWHLLGDDTSHGLPSAVGL
jgi:hypothetical protein